MTAELGSVADWVGALGGLTGAGTAVAFYYLDRRRTKSERRANATQEAAEQAMVEAEFSNILYDSIKLLQMAQNSARTEDVWNHYNGMFINQAVRMRELMASAARRSELSIRIGKAAHILTFSNLPLVHMDLWEDSVAEAEAKLQRILDEEEFAL